MMGRYGVGKDVIELDGEEYKAENFVKIAKKKPRERTANMAFNVFDGN